MKIVSLNTWCGRAGRESLLAFFEKYKDTTDVFCLQEICATPYEFSASEVVGGWLGNPDDMMTRGMQDISQALPNYTAHFRLTYLDYGLFILVKNEWRVSEEGEMWVHKYKTFIPDGDAGKHARNIQFVTLETPKGLISVINFHGLWNGQGKEDTPDRLEQSRRVVEALRRVKGEVVLCGDFNLRPDTHSIKIIEDAGLVNLIKKHGITSTRTSYYKKPEKFADYAFVSKGLDVKDFRVLPDEVSDHAPLWIEIESNHNA